MFDRFYKKFHQQTRRFSQSIPLVKHRRNQQQKINSALKNEYLNLKKDSNFGTFETYLL